MRAAFEAQTYFNINLIKKTNNKDQIIEKGMI